MPDTAAADVKPDLVLESPRAGLPNHNVIAELIALRAGCADAAGDYNKAIKRVAEKHKLKPGALKRYVAAVDGDKVKDARVEVNDLERLLDGATEIAQ